MKKCNLFLTILIYLMIIACSDTTNENTLPNDNGKYIDPLTGIKIIWVTENDMFPEDWSENPINSSAISLEKTEINRSLEVIISVLNEYSQELLSNNIERIYILHSLNFYGVSFGGTNSMNRIYLSNRGEQEGHTNLWIKQSFHHELSSILLRNYPEYFDENSWHQINPTDFSYGEGGSNAIIDGNANTEIDIAYLQFGFLNQYSTSSLENDFNEFAKNIFKSEMGFWNFVDTHNQIQQKVTLTIDFYNNLDPMFTENYFRGLSNTYLSHNR